MPEVTYPCRHHRHIGSVHGGDHILVAHGPSRLDDRCHAGVDRELRTVGEGKERIGGQGCSGEQVGLGRAGFVDGQADGVDPTRLAGANADRGAAGGDDDRVGAYVAADAPGEQEVLPLGVGGGGGRHRAHVRARL